MLKEDTHALVRIALLSALLVITSKFSVILPLGLPITLQVFALVIILHLLNPNQALLCVFIYIILGIIGVPVFANNSGAQAFFSPTFGFILAFISGVYFGGRIVWSKKQHKYIPYIGSIMCCLIIDIFGPLYFFVMQKYFLNTSLAFSQIISMFFGLIFIDIIKAIIATKIALKLKLILKY